MALGRSTKDFFAGRWQVPVALVAASATAVALFRMRPPPLPPNTEELFNDVALIAAKGQPRDAANAAANLLELKPPLPPAQRARLHDTLVNLTYAEEAQHGQHVEANLKMLLDHYAAARELGFPPAPQVMFQAATARDWLGDNDGAIHLYDQVVAAATGDEQRAALHRLVELHGRNPQRQEERHAALARLLDAAAGEPAELWWALQRVVGDALDAGDAVGARVALERYGRALRGTAQEGYYHYLDALILVHEGRMDDAGPVLKYVQTWITDRGDVSTRLDSDTDLTALTRWLLGRVNLDDARPQDALDDFEAALARQPAPTLRQAAMVGRAQALAALERHAAALAAFKAAAAELPPQSQDHGARAALRGALVELYAARQKNGAYDSALPYLELAVQLTPASAAADRGALCARLGQALAAAADAADTAERGANARHVQAGQYLEEAAGLSRENFEHQQDLRWAAAEQYDVVGRAADVRRALVPFINAAGADPRLAQALLRVGQSYEVQRQYPDAITWYDRLAREFPTLEEAVRARMYTADCYAAQGESHWDDAQNVLEHLLSGNEVAPEAAVYRDAFLRLCDLLVRRNRYAEAISRLEAFRELYPNDTDLDRVLFLTAETYRRSALELRAGHGGAPAPRTLEEATQRLRTASSLYTAFLARVGEQPAPHEPGNAATYRRLALFGRADCLCALNIPETLREAREAYRQAAALYERQPAALAAEVQIANVCLRLGEVPDAARAIERARWLLHNIPAEAFAATGASDRDAWERYLTAVAGSHLFHDVLARQP